MVLEVKTISVLEFGSWQLTKFNFLQIFATDSALFATFSESNFLIKLFDLNNYVFLLLDI